jgi:hypothetical protein
MNASSTMSQEQRSLGSTRQITSFRESQIVPSSRAMTEALTGDIAGSVQNRTQTFVHERSRSGRSTHHPAITKREQNLALMAAAAPEECEQLQIPTVPQAA